MKPGRIYRNRGELEDSSLNRSPHSYTNNPEGERHRYTEREREDESLCICPIHVIDRCYGSFRYEWNTDKQVVVLKFTDSDGDGIGMLR